MNLGGSHSFEFGKVKMVSALHSSVLPDGTYGGSPGGFVVSNAGGAFYYAGDTALTLDMQLIPQEFSLDFAVLPIGDNFTMGMADAARAAKLLACKDVVGVHYDTFPPIVIDHTAAVETFKQSGVSLHLPPIGGTINLKE
jgi:L-ascorbate metabolism protein UlaG (beta-lactamase superfamily)